MRASSSPRLMGLLQPHIKSQPGASAPLACLEHKQLTFWCRLTVSAGLASSTLPKSLPHKALQSIRMVRRNPHEEFSQM